MSGSVLSPLPQDKGSLEAEECWHVAVPLARVAGVGDRALRSRPPGLVPLPLPAVLGVAKDQPESPPDDPGLAEPSPCVPLPPLRQAHEEDRG